ncbi:MAG: biotin/lipoyl-containing protein [Candidatus Cryptobacteroides sp.]
MPRYRYIINGHTYDIAIGNESGGAVEVTVNGKNYTVERQEAAAGMEPETVPSRNEAAATPVTAAVPASPAKTSAAPATNSNEAAVTAPLPGTIIAIKVRPGDRVTENQTVAILEAMKMENGIEAGCSGTVSSIKVAERDTVLEGAVLITISR